MPKRASAPKSRTLMYTQQLSHLPFSDVDSLYEAIESRLGPKRYAGIMHDHDMKDNGSSVADHVHVMMSFSNPRSPSNVAKLLGDKPQSVEIWTGRAAEKNGFSYLCHRTAGARGKFQYPLDAVRANFDYVKEMEGIEADVIRSTSHSNIKVLLDALLDGSIDREALVSQLSGSEFARARKQIDDVYARRLQVQAEEWRKRMLEEGREITTIWIFGPPGAGKTSLAKKYAEERGTGYFVSGSSATSSRDMRGSTPSSSMSCDRSPSGTLTSFASQIRMRWNMRSWLPLAISIRRLQSSSSSSPAPTIPCSFTASRSAARAPCAAMT